MRMLRRHHTRFGTPSVQWTVDQSYLMFSLFFPVIAWGKDDSKMLLDYYTLYAGQVGPLKKFRTKKAMFDQIAKKIKELMGVSRTGTQCETRYKTMMRTRKNQVDNNRRSGSARCTIDYEQEFASIAALDDSVEPEVMRGVRSVVYKEGPTLAATSSVAAPQCSTEAAPTVSSQKRGRTADRSQRPSTDRMRHMTLFFEKMEELQKQKEVKKEEREKKAVEREARREERHQELLSAHREHIAAIQKLLQHREKS